MELIDRYLQAVRFWLPKAQRDDIVAELAEDIRSQIEDKEAGLGRKLQDGELEAVLRGCGQPFLVAQRYLPQQHLIGPVLFPIYCFVLKICAWVVLFPSLLVWLGFIIFSPAHHVQDMIHNLRGLPLTVLYPVFFFVTLSFVFFEKCIIKSLLEKDWDPRKLPQVRDANRIQRSSSIFDLTASIAFLIWWMSVMRFRTVFELAGATITLTPQWLYFLGGFLLVSLATVALSWVNLFHPHWTRLRASARLAYDCIGSTLFCWLLKSAILAEIILPHAPPEKSLAATNTINLWISRMFPAAIIFGLIIILIDIRRIFRVKPAVATLAQCAAAGVL